LTKPRKVFFLLLGALMSPVLLAGLLLLAFWIWTGTDTSLATALRQASRYLPAGQALVAQDVRGTLRQGGHIGLLRWEKNGLTVEARQIDLVWQPRALLDRRLQLDRLHVAELDINDQSPDTGAAPLDDLVLPFQADLTFAIDALRSSGKLAQQVTELSGRYQFDGTRHALQLNSARLAAGQYRGEATLLARAPLTLDAKVQGDVLAAIPGNSQPLRLSATALAQGNLAGPQPLLSVQATVGPTASPLPSRPPSPGTPATAVTAQSSPAPATAPMQAQLAAQINPWAEQPIVKADASFSNLNLALLWPDTPQTLLTGTAQIQPDAAASKPITGSASAKGLEGLTGAAWQAQTSFTNTLAGPWNLNRLPVDAAQARLSFHRGQWLVQSLAAEVAGGRISAQGNLNAAAAIGTPPPAISGWQVQATLQNVNPAALHTQLAPARVDGKINATAMPSAASQPIDFDATLQPSTKQPDASRLNGLRLKNAAAKGRWAGGTVSLQTLKIETSDALLQGKLDVQPGVKAAQGELQLTLPGGNAQVQGKLGEKDGGGDFVLRLSDAGKASRWLETLPGAEKMLLGYAMQGNGELTGAWTGGWRAALQGPVRGPPPGSSQATLPDRLQSTVQGSGLTVRSTLRVPQLDVSGPQQTPAQALRLRDVQAEVSGSLTALTLKAGGQWLSGTRRFNLQTQATGGRNAAGNWQAVVGSARVQTQDSLQPGTWTAQMRQPVSVSWTTTATDQVLDIGAGESSLIGPSAGSASIAWRPVRWRQSGARNDLATQGQLQSIPMAWLDLLADAQLANLGLRGDLVFDGDWDVLAGDTLKAKASLVRRSGDISIQAEGATGTAVGTGSTISAGVKDARMTLTADGDALRVSGRWDSERAGLAQADFSTSITSVANEGWRWPADAILAGTLRAQLPQVGVWSVLAPPGWRIRGTLDANIAVAGTRSAPQWRGTLDADSLALRSIADGIEFSNGRLRSVLNGQRLEINEFSLQGAGGGGSPGASGPVAGGLLNAKGFAEWLSTGTGTGTAAVLSKVRIELAMQAQALRVSARADRRLAVSGNLQAKLIDAKLEIRGALKADQALFILPDENTPSLGDDVVIKPSVKKTGSASPTGAATPPSTANPTPTAPAGQTPAARDAARPASNGARLVPDVALTVDMGPDFRVQGRGLNTRLSGTLNLASSSATLGVPRLTGTLTTVRGSYKAYGQQLDIEEGVMRFSGPYDNPALDILAIRPNLTVRVGVQVSGTALSPRVRLYAEPELPDAEKLAWLVLGRSGANGGAESAVLQQAALALLGGNGKGLSGGLAEALGLDELSFRGSASNADGTTSAAAVTLGKRLSRNFYVAYERSVAGTLGTVYIFYDLSKRFTLRAQTGEQSAIDLIFTVPYD
jgi:translocation and assembly module TamB